MAATVVRNIAIRLAALARSETGAITWRHASRTGTARIGTARTGTTRTTGTTGKDAEHRSAVLRGGVIVFMPTHSPESCNAAQPKESTMNKLLSTSALSLLVIATATWPASAACGERGGPGYRGPNGKCVGWEAIGRVCGSPPTTHCTP